MLARALVLLVLGGASGLAVQALGPAHFRPWAFAADVVCHGGAVTELGAEEAQALCASPTLVIADARPAARFAEGHIAGAIHLPCSGDAARLSALEHAEKILVYGDSTDEATRVASSLGDRPNTQIYVLRDGFAAWTKAGMACAPGACPACGGDHGNHADHEPPAESRP